MSRSIAAGLAGLALLAGSGCHSMVTVSRDFVLEPCWENFERVVVRSRNGDIRLVAGEGGECSIRGVKTAGGATIGEAAENVELVEVVASADVGDPRTLIVVLEYPESLRNRRVGADVDVRVPARCRAELCTGNGTVSARRIRGPAVLSTSNGRVEASDVEGPIEARSSNGSIVLRDVTGAATCDTSNGGIRIEGAAGDVDATTSNGSIHVAARPGDEGRIAMRTSNGNIEARIPGGIRGEISLSTTNGRIRFDLGEATLTRPRWTRSSLEATLNGGGAGRVHARTSNGFVTIEPY